MYAIRSYYDPIVYVNQAFTRVTGYARSASIGRVGPRGGRLRRRLACDRERQHVITSYNIHYTKLYEKGTHMVFAVYRVVVAFISYNFV